MNMLVSYKPKKLITIGLIVVLLSNLFSLSLLFSQQIKYRDNLRADTIDAETANIDILEEFLYTQITTVAADLLHLTDSFQQTVLRAEKENMEPTLLYDSFLTEWLSLSEHKRLYSKIRFIDVKGQEIIRINYSSDGPYIVGEGELQNKSERYFFQESIAVKQGQIYISKFDLDMDDQDIVYPQIPTVRFATTVFGQAGEVMGVIIINYQLDELLAFMDQVAKTTESTTYWLNEKGYYLYNQKEPDRTWGFMFEDRQNDSFAADQPELWNYLRINDRGFFVEDRSFVMYRGLSMSEIGSRFSSHTGIDLIASSNNWLLVSIIEPPDPVWIAFESNFFYLLAYTIRDNLAVIIIVLLLTMIAFTVWLMNVRSSEKLHRYSFDQLTSAFTRHSGLELLRQQIREAAAENAVITICFCDINGLKQVNDTFGHEHGDELIRISARTIKACIRHDDFLIRMGGDEFLIVFYDSDTRHASIVWDRIQNTIDRLNAEPAPAERFVTGAVSSARQPAKAVDSGTGSNSIGAFTSIGANANSVVQSAGSSDSVNPGKFKRPYLISISHGFDEIAPGSNYSLDYVISSADSRMYEEKKRLKESISVIRSAAE